MGMALSNADKNITWVNTTFENYLGISAADIDNHSISNLPEILQPLFTTSGVIHIPANAVHDDQWYMCNQQEVNGNTAHYITDVGPLHLLMQERESLQNELREALAVDEITGLPNKVALFQSLEPQISRSRRYNNILSIVILRINHLENLDKADCSQLLLAISQMLSDQVRWADIVGKLNESDFMLVLPETGIEACATLCENLTNRLNSIVLPEELPDDYTLSASFGYSEWAKGDDLVLLMQKAKKMLG